MSSSTASVLAEPFDAYLHRRVRSTVALTAGEVVTAAVGLLRGCRRATGRIDGTIWWLTASGCPVIVEDPGGPDAVEATAQSLAQLSSAAVDDTTRSIVDRARESVLTRPPRDWDAVEHRLFLHAAPAPLILGPLIPAPEATSPPPSAQHGGPVVHAIGLVDSDLAEMTKAALHGIREAWRSSRGLRMMTVGGAAAVLALVAFVCIPRDTPVAPPPAASTPAPAAVTPQVLPAQASPPPAIDERVPLSDDVVEAARAVFADIARCQQDPACVSAFEESSVFPREPLVDDAAIADIALVDDFGGVTVVRVDSGESTQYVTLVRQNDRWLVRAVRTVTDQPS